MDTKSLRVVMALAACLVPILAEANELEVTPACLRAAMPASHAEERGQATATVADWTRDAVSDAYHLTSADYVRQLDALQARFTPLGWSYWKHTLDETGTMYLLHTERMRISVSDRGRSKVATYGTCHGHPFWTVHVPLEAHWEALGKSGNQPLDVLAVTMQDREGSPHLGLVSVDAEGNLD